MTLNEKVIKLKAWCASYGNNSCDGCPLCNKNAITWCYTRPSNYTDDGYKTMINRNYAIVFGEDDMNYIEDTENGLGVKVFISGKITGDPNYREKFKKAEDWLKEHNFTVLNPAVFPGGMTIADYMNIGINMLSAADWVYMLSDWEESRGARIEHEYAKYVGKHIAYERSED